MMGLPGREGSLTISSTIWIQCANVTDEQMDRQTDRQTDTGRQQRPRLRGKSGHRDHYGQLLRLCGRRPNRCRLVELVGRRRRR